MDDEYSDVELLGHFVKVCLPITKNNNLPKEAPREHLHLPEFPTLGKLTEGVDEYYSEQEKSYNQLILKALVELENKDLMGKWDETEYMSEVNRPEKKMKKGYKIEMYFSYLDEGEENRFK